MLLERVKVLQWLQKVEYLRELVAELDQVVLTLDDAAPKTQAALQRFREGLQRSADQALENALQAKWWEENYFENACFDVPPTPAAVVQAQPGASAGSMPPLTAAGRALPGTGAEQPPPAAGAGAAGQPATALGVDTTDPATLPEPVAPAGGHLVLVQTNITPHTSDPSVVVSARPQNTTVTTIYGTGDCKWTMPPKTLVAHEQWRFDFNVRASAPVGQRYTQNLVVTAGFVNVHARPTEVVVNVEGGQSDSASGSVEFDTGPIEGFAPEQLWWIRVGACGANIDYVYQYRS